MHYRVLLALAQLVFGEQMGVDEVVVRLHMNARQPRVFPAP